MRASSRHTAVVFDAFGTLIKPVERRVSVYSRLSASVGLARMPDRDTIMTRPMSIEALATEAARPDLAAYLRGEIDHEVAQLSLYDDMAATLRALRSAGLKLGVCSNLGMDYGPVVHRLLPGLDAYILSFEVGARKPDPAIFGAVCRQLRCQPCDLLFVGDSKRADYEGPIAFGMSACLVDRPHQTLGQTVAAALRR